MTQPSPSFRDNLAFLSNFYPAETEYEGVVYPTAEHAYQAAKTSSPTSRRMILSCRTPGQAKRLGKRLESPYWDRRKVGVMRRILKSKFKNSDLMLKLHFDTPREIIEYNPWHDTFWGRCTCPTHRGRGQNWLGELLMEVRGT